MESTVPEISDVSDASSPVAKRILRSSDIQSEKDINSRISVEKSEERNEDVAKRTENEVKLKSKTGRSKLRMV